MTLLTAFLARLVGWYGGKMLVKKEKEYDHPYKPSTFAGEAQFQQRQLLFTRLNYQT